MRPWLMIVLLLLSCQQCLAGEDKVILQLDAFQGTVGTHTVQVQLGHLQTTMVGSYHYGAKAVEDKLQLQGHPEPNGAWQVTEIVTTPNKGKNQISGHWRLQPEGDGWRGTWTKADGSGALPIHLLARTLAASYAELPATSLRGLHKLAAECTLHVFRQQKEAETLDISVEDETGCDRADLLFQDLNFDGHEDLQYALDSPGHNTSYHLALFDPKTQRFVPAGVLTEPAVDPVHHNIYVEIHYSCCAHSTSIYRFQKGAAEPSLIEEQIPCSSRPAGPQKKGIPCVENYFYDPKSGHIQADLEDEPSTDPPQQLAQ